MKDLDASVLRYNALLSIRPQQSVVSSWAETKTTEFSLCSTTITLAAPTGINSQLRKHLTARGEGPYALRLTTSDKAKAGMLEPTLTRGSRIELVYE